MCILSAFIFLCFTLDLGRGGGGIPELSVPPINLVVFNKVHPYNFADGL